MCFFRGLHKGDDECAKCFILKSGLLHCGSSGASGNKGMLENIIDYIDRSYHESMSSL